MAKVIEITTDKAKKAHKNATPEQKRMLEDLCGKEHFIIDIMNSVSDFYDICEIAGVDPAKYIITDDMDDDARYGILCNKLRLIEDTINGDEVIDLSDITQLKWRPWFKWNGSGFGFSRSGYVCDCTISAVGSRFASEKKSDFAGRTFTKEYNDVIMFKKKNK